jgi:hypothetical protein
MKTKLFCLLGCLFLALTFTSCSDDDGVGSSEDLIGKWELYYEEGWEKVDGKIQSEWSDYDNYLRIIFYENKEFLIQEYSTRWYDDLEGTWSLKSGKLKLVDSDYDDEYETYTVKTLDDTTLILELHETFREDGENWEEYESMSFHRISE